MGPWRAVCKMGITGDMRVLLGRETGPRAAILMYHSVVRPGDERSTSGPGNPDYEMPLHLFSEQMRMVRKGSYRTLALDELLDADSPVSEHRNVLITFDDGWSDNHSNALPVLNEYGLKATVFVITGFVGKENYLDWGRLREMQSGGVSVQSHSHGHRPLSLLSDGEMRSELQKSKRSIEDRLGTPVHFLSAPHGMVDRRLIQEARVSGYRGICTSEPGFGHQYGSPAVFSRINISARLDAEKFENVIRQKRSAVLTEMVLKKTKNFAKKSLGYERYRKLYELRYPK